MASAALQVHFLASENWDDDYEFQPETNKSEPHPHPRRRPKTVPDTRKMSIASSLTFDDWDADDGPTNVPLPSSSTSPAILHQHVEHQSDNWDDDFEDSRGSPKKVVNADRKEENWDDDDDLDDDTEDDGLEFGFAEKEEDRTVTAKSRRAALKRLSSSSNSNSVPPPPLPTHFLNISQQPYRTFQQQPFPRSPTSSIFSIPTTANTIQTHDHFYSSTTHLRPSSAFALLPPSPPIHKERERRRLRKKSRPKPQGTFELVSLRGDSININRSETHLGSSSDHRHSFSDDGDAEHSTCEPSRPFPDVVRLGSGTPMDDVSSADDRRAVVPPLPQTPAKGAALLSRIGSVKKWGVRRKRASTTPSEVIADNIERTPRVKSSRTSLHANVPSSRNSMFTPAQPEPSTSTSKKPQQQQQQQQSDNNTQSSNWFFRASSAGSAYAHVGGRTGGGPSSKGYSDKEAMPDIGDEHHQVSSRQRSESVNQNRSGRIAIGNVNGSRTDFDRHGSVPSTPNKLVKRKSFGFIQLKKLVVVNKEVEEEDREPTGNDGARKGRYADIGLGHAATRGEGSANERDFSGQEHERRGRRKSFSRFLFDRDKENEVNGSSKDEAPEKGKDGSRGFMGSVRRISLVGKQHKRTKSGNGETVPPLPSSSVLLAQKLSARLPFSLPPLPNSSQLSLRLPSSSSPNQPPQTGSMYDLPSALSHPTFPSFRTTSGASTQTHTSVASSVVPASSRSSSRNTTGSDLFQQTPRPLQRNMSVNTRPRTSQESAKPRKSISSQKHASLDGKMMVGDDDDVSFVTKLSQCQPIPSSQALVTSSSTPPLLPPIELQPPSPPHTLAERSEPESKPKPSNILTVFDSTCKLSPSASSSSVFFTPSSSPQRGHGSPSPNLKTSSKLHVPHSPLGGKNVQQQQSVSLGRATTTTTALSGSPSTKEGGNPNASGANAGSPYPRRNSLGDLKIPARISQAQVGLRRDLGMVREFANNIEQLKELQRTYDALVIEIQSILDKHVVRHEQQQIQTSASSAPADVTNLFPLNAKRRPRSNTNRSTYSETSKESPITPAQIAYNELASAFYVIESKYRITWECADLLIELGGGSANGSRNDDDMASPPASTSAPVVLQSTDETQGTKRGRGRAITLAGDEPSTQPGFYSASASASGDSPVWPPSALASPLTSAASWRTSTGRHDLSQRQLVLLREMLNNSHAHSAVGVETDDSQADVRNPIPDKKMARQPGVLRVTVNKEWKWGADPKSSTVTLPSEESGDRLGFGKPSFMGGNYKRRSGKLGMSGLRDLLRALKRNAAAEGSAPPPPPPAMVPAHSTTSLSTQSSIGSNRLRKLRQPSQHRRARQGVGPDSLRSASDGAKVQEREAITSSPYGSSFADTTKPSPRRPSLASIFRIGGKSRHLNTNVVPRAELVDGHVAVPNGGVGEENSSAEEEEGVEEDWDRMDSASDLDMAARVLAVGDGSATVRGDTRRKKKSRSYVQQDTTAHSTTTDRCLVTKRSIVGSQATILRESEPQKDFLLPSVSGPLRPVRLSNVEEHADDASGGGGSSSLDHHPPRSFSQPISNAQSAVIGPSRPPVFTTKSANGSVRSMPAHGTTTSESIATTTTTGLKPPLAMTPENIRPLLENAKEVQARLGDCISELRVLVQR